MSGGTEADSVRALRTAHSNWLCRWLIDTATGEPLTARDLENPDTIREHRISFDNGVTLIVDGADYIRRWRDELMAVSTRDDLVVLHAAWRFDDIRIPGRLRWLERWNQPDGELTTFEVMKALADKNPGRVAISISTHLGGLASRRTIRSLRKSQVLVLRNYARRRLWGSSHDKFTIVRTTSNDIRPMAMIGIDISRTRWDTTAHHPVDIRRPVSLGRPTHDVGALVHGTAAHDLERQFRLLLELSAESAHSFATSNPRLPDAPHVPHRTDEPSGVCVQVLHSLKAMPPSEPDHSLWFAYRNAIEKAERYIYIEDQYFTPTLFGLRGKQSLDVFHALLRAVDRGVSVLICLPSPRRHFAGRQQMLMRHIALAALLKASASAGGAPPHPEPGTSPGETTQPRGGMVLPFEVVRLGRPVYVHAKNLIVDDEYALVGSHNVNGRSVATDSESSIAVLDPALVAGLRMRLWAEHLSLPVSEVEQVGHAIRTFARHVRSGDGTVRAYRPEPLPHHLTRRLKVVFDQLVEGGVP